MLICSHTTAVVFDGQAKMLIFVLQVAPREESEEEEEEEEAQEVSVFPIL